MLAKYARLMLIFHAICSKYARNIHGNLSKIHKTTLSSCCCVCSVHGRSTSILGGVFLFFYPRISSNILEYGRKVRKWCNMLKICSKNDEICSTYSWGDFFTVICSENMPTCSMRGSSVQRRYRKYIKLYLWSIYPGIYTTERESIERERERDSTVFNTPD